MISQWLPSDHCNHPRSLPFFFVQFKITANKIQFQSGIAKAGSQRSTPKLEPPNLTEASAIVQDGKELGRAGEEQLRQIRVRVGELSESTNQKANLKTKAENENQKTIGELEGSDNSMRRG